jgi:hypothetical protein
VADPPAEVVGGELLLTLDLHHLGMAGAQKPQRTPGRAGMNRLPIPVENKNGSIKHGFHRFFRSIVGKLAKPPVWAIEKPRKAAVACTSQISP